MAGYLPKNIFWRHPEHKLMERSISVGVKPARSTIPRRHISKRRLDLLESSSAKRQKLDVFPGKTWNTKQVADWLQTTLFGAPYVQTFVDQKVDGEKLATLNGHTLKNEYGVSNTMHRFRLKLVINQLRLETRHDLQQILYPDVIYIVLSFLDVDNLNSVMAVSKTICKLAKKARKNTERLVVKSFSNPELYLEKVLASCRRVKSLKFLRGMSLSREQMQTLVKSYADSVSGISVLRTESVCCNGVWEEDHLYPIKCDSYFLSFLAKTAKKLKAISYKGCFQEKDFSEFVMCTSLVSVWLCSTPQRWHAGASIDTLLEGIKVMLERNQRHLISLSIGKFVGFRELLVKGPELPSLRNLSIFNCEVSPTDKKRIVEKFPAIEELHVVDNY